MGVPFNESNAVYDLGFKALPWGDTGYLPATWQEAGTAPAAGCPGAPDYPANIAGSVRAKKGKLSKFFFEQRNRVLGKLASALKATEPAELRALSGGLDAMLSNLKSQITP